MKLKNRIVSVILLSLLLCPKSSVAFAGGGERKSHDMADKIRQCYERKNMDELEPYHRDFVAKCKKYIKDGTDFDENPFPIIFGQESLGKEKHDRLVRYIANSPNKELFENLYAELLWISYVNSNRGDSCGVLRNCSCGDYNFSLQWMCSIFGCFDFFESCFEREKYEESLGNCSTYTIFSKKLRDFYGYDNINIKFFYYCLYAFSYVVRKAISSKSLSELSIQEKMLTGLELRVEELKRCGDPTMEILAQGLQESLIRRFWQNLQNQKKSEFEKDKKAEEPKSLGESRERYIPLGCGLGSGARGWVSVYIDTETGEEVAVKTLYCESFDEKVLERMQRVKSPYIVKALDWIDLGDGKKGVVMECVHGAQYLDYGVQRFTDKKQVLDICLQVAHGFKAFEDANLCVTDFSHYGNILLDDEGNVKFIDYDDAVDCRPGYNLKASLREIGTILAATDESLLNDFSKRLEIGVEVFSNEERPISAGVAAPDRVLSAMTFEKIIQTLEDMKKNITDSAVA